MHYRKTQPTLLAGPRRPPHAVYEVARVLGWVKLHDPRHVGYVDTTGRDIGADEQSPLLRQKAVVYLCFVILILTMAKFAVKQVCVHPTPLRGRYMETKRNRLEFFQQRKDRKRLHAQKKREMGTYVGWGKVRWERGRTHLLLATVIRPLITHPFRDGAPLQFPIETPPKQLGAHYVVSIYYYGELY